MADTVSIGAVASSIAQPIDIAGHLLTDVALLVGLVCLMASLFRYMQHRENRLAYPISTVIAFFLMGAAFVCFPVLYKYFEQQPDVAQSQTSGVVAPAAAVSGVVTTSGMATVSP